MNRLEYWTGEGYTLGLLKGIALVVYKQKLGVGKVPGGVLTGVSFEVDCDGNIEGVGPV